MSVLASHPITHWLYRYQFYIPLPLNLPGSVELKQKGGAIRYELQANFFHKPKS